MEADFDLDESGQVRPTSKPRRYQPGMGGRPAGYSPGKAKEMQERMEAGETPDEDDPESEEGRLSTSVKTAIAKARKETALAGLNELDLKVKSGQYLPRDAYQQATATLLAMLSQGLRSLPDTLERKCNLPPEALEMVEAVIDESLLSIADTLALFTESKP